MLIDILLKGRKALVVGGGKVGERKALQLLDSGAEVIVVSRDFTEKLMELGRAGRIRIEKADINKEPLSSLGFKPHVVIVALNDRELNRKAAEEAKTIGALVCVADDPAVSDFAMPAIAKVGGVRIGVSTEGSSPAMAGVIRRRIEGIITKNDVRRVELQRYARVLAKEHIGSHEERRRVLHRIIGDGDVNRLLDGGRMDEARRRARRIIVQAREEGATGV